MEIPLRKTSLRAYSVRGRPLGWATPRILANTAEEHRNVVDSGLESRGRNTPRVRPYSNDAGFRAEGQARETELAGHRRVSRARQSGRKRFDRCSWTAL